MTATRNSLLLSVLTIALGLVPGMAPVAPAAGVILRVSPGVRAIIGGLRQLDVPVAWR